MYYNKYRYMVEAAFYVDMWDDIVAAFRGKILKSRTYSVDVYCAMCNMCWIRHRTALSDALQKLEWIHRRKPDGYSDYMSERFRNLYSCSWRYAGGRIAEIRDVGENYMDFYCSGYEGMVTPEIEKDFNVIGWYKHPWDGD